MPSKKSGKIVSPENVTEPKEPYAADQSDPGKVEEAKAKEKKNNSGKYGDTPVTPFEPPPPRNNPANPGAAAEDKEETTWIEVELKDEQNNPVGGEKYEIELPDGTTARGTLNNEGMASITGIPPGSCKIKFPNLDQETWE